MVSPFLGLVLSSDGALTWLSEVCSAVQCCSRSSPGRSSPSVATRLVANARRPARCPRAEPTGPGSNFTRGRATQPARMHHAASALRRNFARHARHLAHFGWLRARGPGRQLRRPCADLACHPSFESSSIANYPVRARTAAFPLPVNVYRYFRLPSSTRPSTGRKRGVINQGGIYDS